MRPSKIGISDLFGLDTIGIRETSRKFNISPSYVHEKFSKWVREGYLVKARNKYRTNFIISREEVPLKGLPNCFAYIETIKPSQQSDEGGKGEK